MPDPRVLYVVTAVVVLGLIAWVAVVLLVPAPAEPAKKDRPRAEPAKDDGPASSRPAASRRAPRLDAHEEIRDEPAAEGVAEVEENPEPTGPHALILVNAVGRTDPGLKRQHNEDAYAILEAHHLFLIADGMGRHAAGEVASRLCVDTISEAFRKGKFGPPRASKLPRRAARIRNAILLANERVLAAARENEAYRGMGTTVVCAYFSANNQRAYIAHVGDSRCYRLREGELVQITTDHTLGAVGIRGVSAAVLSRAVGVEADVEVDVAVESPLPGDVYLLCSDGLSRMLSDEEIRATLEKSTGLDEATKGLVDKANEMGGRDNITTILIRVDDVRAAALRARNGRAEA
jgi:protein phosphatase